MKRATIYQVAEHAGVSHQTVSRYLRNNGVGMKHATLTRVEAAIDDSTTVRTCSLARCALGAPGRIAVLLPAATELLPLTLLSAVSAAARQAGYAVDLVALEGSTAERAASPRSWPPPVSSKGFWLWLLSAVGRPIPPRPPSSSSPTTTTTPADWARSPTAPPGR